MTQESDLRAEFNENYRYAQEFWNTFVADARVYTLAASGYTWSNDEKKALVKEGREPIEYNIMRRPLSFYSGYLRDNINSIVIAPVESSDQETADQLTKLSSYVWDKGRGYRTFLDAADESMKSGISLCGLMMDYSKDFVNGDLKFFKRTYNSFFIDPTFESTDLSDAAFVMTRDLLSRGAAKALLPFVEPSVIDDIQTSFRDDKFITFHPQFTNLSRNRDLLAYDQYYKKVGVPKKYLVDRKSGFSRDITNLPKEEMDRLKVGLGRLRSLRESNEFLGIEERDLPDVEIQDVTREEVELHIFLNGIHVWSGQDKTGIVETYPFYPLICFLEPSIFDPRARLQGLASTMYSAQRQFNKRHMKITDIMDTAISTGFKYLIGSVPDTTDMLQSGQSRLIGVDPDAAPQGLDSVQELRGGDVNNSLLEYQSVLDRLTMDLANVNETLFGTDQGGNTQISGRLAQVRTANGVRSNRKVFDNIEYSQQLIGGLVLKGIQKNYPPEKVERILGEEPTAQFYDQEFEQYDAIVKQGVLSQSQRDSYYFELVNLKRDGIVDVPQSEIIKSLPLAGKSDLLESIEAQQEAQQAQQQKIDEQERLAMEIGNAQKEESLALAQSRRARVLGEIGLMEERASEASQNRAQAALDRAKTMTEIAKLEDDRLIKVVQFVRELNAQEKADRDEITDELINASNKVNVETDGSFENKLFKEVLSSAQQPTMSGDLEGGQI